MHNSTFPEEIKLSNGIPVILQHYAGHVAATYWWVKVGSADELPGEEGFAHFLEHMLFKDAAAKEMGIPSSGQMAEAIESCGGEINAFTSFDQTVYHVTCAEGHWEKILTVFGDLAKPQSFLKEDFLREREVILEELRKNEDNPGRQLFETLFKTTFSKHPYGRPVIGYAKTLKSANVKQLEIFYRKHYISQNMGLVIVGPMDEPKRKEGILKTLEKKWGQKIIPEKKLSSSARVTDNPLRKEVALVKKTFDVQSPTLALSFRVPDLKHPDLPILDLIVGVLSLGELSRLYQRLFYQNALVTDVSGGLYVPKDPGMLFFQMETESISKIHAILDSVFDEFKRLTQEGPTPEELSRVIVTAESEKLYSTQTADSMASRLGFLKFVLDDLNYDQKYLESLRQVNVKKFQETARKYLVSNRMSLALLLPKEEKNFALDGLREKIQKNLLSDTIQKEKPLQRAKARFFPEVIQSPLGISLIYQEKPLSHVVSVQAVALGGVRLELPDWGVSHLLSQTWAKGTHQKTAREISSIVEGSAAGLEGFSGRNTIGLSLTSLARDWEKLSSLFTEILAYPSFQNEEVSHSKRITEEEIKSLEDHSSQLCIKLFLETLYEEHPYGRWTTGSLESVSKIQGDKLKDFHQKWIRPERLVISVVGAVQKEKVLLWLEQLEQLLKDNKGQASSPSLPQEESDLKAPRWVEKKLKREQTHILVGGLGCRVNSQDRYAVRLLQTLLGGQSGRLFLELREKRSLAYSVAPMSFEGMERGYVGTYIACAPEKRQEAIKGIRSVLEQLGKKGPKESEMKRAQEFYLGRRAMELQSDSSLSSHYCLQTLYGLPFIEEQELSRKIRSIGAKELQKVCQKYFLEPPQVTSVVC